MSLEQAIEHAEQVAAEQSAKAKTIEANPWGDQEKVQSKIQECLNCAEEHRQLASWLRELVERQKEPEIVHCGECAYYDPPHVENNGVRYEYTEMPEEAFDVLGTGLVTAEYGINVGGRCCRDYNAVYDDDKRVYVPENNYCGRAERRTDDKR